MPAIAELFLLRSWFEYLVQLELWKSATAIAVCGHFISPRFAHCSASVGIVLVCLIPNFKWPAGAGYRRKVGFHALIPAFLL